MSVSLDTGELTMAARPDRNSELHERRPPALAKIGGHQDRRQDDSRQHVSPGTYSETTNRWP